MSVTRGWSIPYRTLLGQKNLTLRLRFRKKVLGLTKPAKKMQPLDVLGSPKLIQPDASCMVYLPTFHLKLHGKCMVNIPDCRSTWAHVTPSCYGHPKRTRWNVMVVVPPSLQVEPQTRDEHDKRLGQLQGPKQDFHRATVDGGKPIPNHLLDGGSKTCCI